MDRYCTTITQNDKISPRLCVNMYRPLISFLVIGNISKEKNLFNNNHIYLISIAY